MTPTEKWIFCLALVYAVPSFLSGIGLTLLVVRWHEIRRAAAMTSRLLSPDRMFEPHNVKAPGTSPKDAARSFLPEGLRLR